MSRPKKVNHNRHRVFNVVEKDLARVALEERRIREAFNREMIEDADRLIKRLKEIK